jgi:ankyrin repeat protein
MSAARKRGPHGLAKMAFDGRWEAVLELIETGSADVDEKNALGQTALWIAVKSDRADVVEALVRAGADVNLDKPGGALLLMAAIAGRWSSVTKLARSKRLTCASVDAANERGETALWLAVFYDHKEAVEALVQVGADVNKADAYGHTPLAVAASNGQWSVVTTLARSNSVKDIDAELVSGKTALWLTLRSDAYWRFQFQATIDRAAMALICAGADVDCQCGGKSFLQLFAKFGPCDGRLALLLAAGAATAGVSAVDCRWEVIPWMLAGGVEWTDHEIDLAIGTATLAELRRQVPAAKKRIEEVGFAAIRARILEICIALQPLKLPAPQLIEIVTHTCAPFAARLPYHRLWDAVVMVKHFRAK